MNDLCTRSCEPCTGSTPPLSFEEAQALLSELNEPGDASSPRIVWGFVDERRAIEATFTFDNFAKAISFVTDIAVIAESENHHPDIHIVKYRRVRLVFTTHAIKGLSMNDFVVAAKCVHRFNSR